MATKDTVKKLIRQQESPAIVVAPGSKAALFLKQGTSVNGAIKKPITNTPDSKTIEFSPKVPAGKDPDDGSGEGTGSDRPNLSDIEVVYPPKKVYINGILHWEYEVYVKNTASSPKSVEWVDAQFKKQ